MNCVICSENKSKVISCKKCNNGNICIDCANKLIDIRCPLCRSDIEFNDKIKQQIEINKNKYKEEKILEQHQSLIEAQQSLVEPQYEDRYEYSTEEKNKIRLMCIKIMELVPKKIKSFNTTKIYSSEQKLYKAYCVYNEAQILRDKCNTIISDISLMNGCLGLYATIAKHDSLYKEMMKQRLFTYPTLPMI